MSAAPLSALTGAPADNSVVRNFYRTRDENHTYERLWGYVNPIAAAYWRIRDELVFEHILNRFDPLTRPLHVLEVGSGHGHEIAKFGLLGIPQSNLAGVDLIPDRVRRARDNYPEIHFSEQDATNLQFPDESFDIVLQYTCVMHADSRDKQERMCWEMMRVVKPGGIILWWDIAPMKWRVIIVQRLLDMLMRPTCWRRNAATVRETLCELFSTERRRAALDIFDKTYIRPVAPRELGHLFPGMTITARQAGVDFDIWAPIWRHWRGLADALWRSHWLPRHCFAVIAKPLRDA